MLHKKHLQTHLLHPQLYLIMLYMRSECFSVLMTGWANEGCLMVFVVPVVSHLAVVNGIEKCHSNSSNLEEWSNTSTLGLHILVLPTPPGTAHSTGNSTGSLIATSKPGTQLTQFYLAQWNISCKKTWKDQLFPIFLLRNVHLFLHELYLLPLP